MTRSIGDHEAREIGVICDPEVTNYQLDESCKFLVLGSDGLFEYLTNKEIMDFVMSNQSLHCDELAQLLCEKA